MCKEVEKTTPDMHYKQINSLFHNERNGKFLKVTKSSGDGFAVPHVGRGVAFADFDNDGNVDVVIANNNDLPLLLRNSGAAAKHVVTFRLIGTKSNRDAMGARVILKAGGLTPSRSFGVCQRIVSTWLKKAMIGSLWSMSQRRIRYPI